MRAIKSFLKYHHQNLSRFMKNHYATFLFLLHGSVFRKPLHVQGLKYIKIGKNVSVDSFSRLDVYNISNSRPEVVLEDNVMICFNCTLLVASKLFIGENTTIASKVLITTENHSIDPEMGNYCRQPLITKDVHIGKNCWIGESAVILPGVTIGDYSIVGAGSIVTNNIPEYSMAVGIPAKVIKRWNFDTKRWEKIESNE